MSIFKNGFSLSKSNKPAAPADTLAALEQKLRELMDADPMAGVPALRADRTAALLSGDYDAVNRFDADIRKAELDSEKKELLVEQLHRQIADAKQDEQAAEVEKRVAAAKEKADEMPQALAELERAFDLVREKLAVVEQINDAVAGANELLPDGMKLPNPEWLYRGGLEGEPRAEVRRVNLGDRWFHEGGAPVRDGDVANIKSEDGVRGKLTVLNPDIGFTQTVQVLKRRVKRVVYDEARAAHDFPRLSAETFLPSIMVPDARPPRGQHEQIVLEDIAAPAANASEEAAA
jgi:hypothetical protein